MGKGRGDNRQLGFEDSSQLKHTLTKSEKKETILN